MKKITIFTLFALITSLINAQALLPNRYGVKVGSVLSDINYTSNEGNSSLESSALIGVSGGFYMEIPLTDKWYINPELVYTQKGVDFSYNYTHDYDINSRDEYTTSNTLKLSYVEISPTMSYKANDKIALNIGPSVSFLIEENYSFSETLTSQINPSSTGELLEEGFYESESLDVGLNLGTSYYLTQDLVMEAKINVGFMSIGKVTKEVYTGSTDNLPRSNIYTLNYKSISFSVMYLF